MCIATLQLDLSLLSITKHRLMQHLQIEILSTSANELSQPFT
jgi:hypothetical protein